MTWLIEAEPRPFDCDLNTTALVMIDMQRDFLEPGGFGESLGNDVLSLKPVVAVCEELLQLTRKLGLTVIHTREGHMPDLSDVPSTKLELNPLGQRIGDIGPLGRILIRGEPGNQFTPDLAPLPSEQIIEKSGKGAFSGTGFAHILKSKGIKSLLVAGVTTEVCVHSTVREASDRGFDCLVIADACGSYFPEFHHSALKMISSQGGIFGKVSCFSQVIRSLDV